jgi:hypothetical protein
MSIILALLLMLFVALFLVRGAKIREQKDQLKWHAKYIQDLGDTIMEMQLRTKPIDKSDDD